YKERSRARNKNRIEEVVKKDLHRRRFRTVAVAALPSRRHRSRAPPPSSHR
ncbi:hypothetical protein A2U01_0069292, partial [Trifolium medium]|nr:hypothetical protein [Trifolium medium]